MALNNKTIRKQSINMKNILIIGATGQIGSELTMELRGRYGNDHVVAGYIIGSEPKGELKESGPSEIVDVTDGEMIAAAVKKYHIDTIYNLAALLSVVAESKPKLAWKIGIDGLWNVLEVARENGCAVFTPSSIGSFGPSTPHVGTPQDTIQRPQTMYGVSKVTTELLSDYYSTSTESTPEQYVSLASFPMLLFLAAVPLIMLWISIIQLYVERNSSALSSRVLSWI